jgi:hypothetical protein
MLNATTLAIFNVLPRRGARFVTPEEGAVGVGELGSSHGMASVGPNFGSNLLRPGALSNVHVTLSLMAAMGLQVDRFGV